MIFNKSQELLKRALKVIPNGTQTMSKCYNQWAEGTVPNYIERAEGPYVWDVDGNKFIDTMAALGPIILGYNDPQVNAAMLSQIKSGSIFSLSSPLEVELAEKLAEIIPCCDMVRFGKNGSDVTSIAVRIARSYTGKEYILSPTGHYHGWCDFYAASSSLNRGLPESTKALVEHFKYNDLVEMEEKLKTGKFAAVIMEPCRYDPPADGFLQGVRNLCNLYDVVFILDEIVTSFRWSLGGAQQYYGIVPDLATIGKAMANGMPISALTGKLKFMEQLFPGGILFSGTFMGETVSISAALATINILHNDSDEIYDHIWESGLEYKDEFNNYCKKIGLDAELVGMGPILNIKFNTSDPIGCKDVYCKYMAKNGVLSGQSIYLTWAHKEEHLYQLINSSYKSLDAVLKAMDYCEIDNELDGHRSSNSFKKEISKDQ